MANIDFIYQNGYQKEIPFPLGGIGSGCVGFSGDGRLIDWELHSRPNKQSINGFTHFAIKAQQRIMFWVPAFSNRIRARILWGATVMRPIPEDMGMGSTATLWQDSSILGM